jgi:hypothetical protein
VGFGINFYGFFIYAAVWVCAYSLWARYVNKRKRGTDRTGKDRPAQPPDSSEC